MTSTMTGGTDARVLDPHHSIMELLQTAEVEPGAIIQEDTLLSASLGESWQPVVSTDIDDLPVDNNNTGITRQITNQTNNSTSILSSSDTSEEEELVEVTSEVYKNFHMPTDEDFAVNSKAGSSRAVIGGSIPQSVAGKFNCTYAVEETETSVNGCLTRSTGSSSTSFVMPKLSLTYKSSQLKTLLIIGRPGRVFYDVIPESYREYFELTGNISAHNFDNYIGVIIVFQELKELVSLLNRIIQYTEKVPIIPVCESDQRLKVKNILKTFLKNEMIELMYPPVTISDEKQMNKLFQYTKKLVKKIINKETLRCEENQFFNGAPSVCKTAGNVDDRPKKTPKKKRKHCSNPTYCYGKLLTWGISLTIGVSIGYCATYIITTTLFYGAANTDSLKGVGVTHKVLAAFASRTSINSSIIHSDDYGSGESDNHSLIRNTFSIIKKTFDKINGAMGRMITSIAHLIKQNTIPDDQILALGYMLT